MRTIDADKFSEEVSKALHFHRMSDYDPQGIRAAVCVALQEVINAVERSTVDPSRARVTPNKQRKKH